jgi:hypothetical protein
LQRIRDILPMSSTPKCFRRIKLEKISDSYCGHRSLLML